MGHVLVLDMGTSSVRASLVDETGRLLALEGERLTIQSSTPGSAEQNAEAWWAACESVVSRVTAQAFAPPAAVTVTNQQITTVPVDAAGSPLAPAMLWMDQRPVTLLDDFGDDVRARVRAVTGVPLSSSWAPSRALWWREHAPAVFAEADAFLTVDAFIYSRLCGRRVTDPSNACFGLMDLNTDSYDDDLAALVGLDPCAYPEIAQSGTIVGSILPEVAERTGLLAGTPVVLSGSDQPCAAIGMGVLADTDVGVTTGTGTFVVRPAAVVPDDDRFIVNRHVAGARYLVMGLHYLSGAAWNWFIDTVDTGHIDRDSLIQQLLNEIWARPAYTSAPILNPYFSGARTPHFDDAARATWSGISLSTSRADLGYSLLESNGFGVRQILDTFDATFEAPAADIRLAGGPSSSSDWCQLQANAIGRACSRADNAESTTLGAALVAMVGLGIHRTIGDAIRDCVSQTTTFVPDAAQAARFERRRATYAELAHRMKGITYD